MSPNRWRGDKPRPRRILIVDDDELIGISLKEALEAEGGDVALSLVDSDPFTSLLPKPFRLDDLNRILRKMP